MNNNGLYLTPEQMNQIRLDQVVKVKYNGEIWYLCQCVPITDFLPKNKPEYKLSEPQEMFLESLKTEKNNGYYLWQKYGAKYWRTAKSLVGKNLVEVRNFNKFNKEFEARYKNDS